MPIQMISMRYSDYGMNKRMTHIIRNCIICLLLAAAAFFGMKLEAHAAPVFDPAAVSEYQGTDSVEINQDKVFFGEELMAFLTGEYYPELDRLGRCGACMALVGPETMPTEPRGEIGMIKPSGWQTVKYDFLEDNFLYNRCHLIGYQLTGERDNPRDLITGTRFMNLNMVPYENRIAQYVQNTGNHVLYRVTPVFVGEDLVARGVLMEAKSIENDDLEFCVFTHNVQPGVTIDYATGNSWAAGSEPAQFAQDTSEIIPIELTDGFDGVIPGEALKVYVYVGNKNTMRFHYVECSHAEKILAHNKYLFPAGTTRDEIIGMNYRPCKVCKP